MIYEKHIRYKGEPWQEEWHSLYLTHDEARRVFLSNNEAGACWKRNGSEWLHASLDGYSILKPEANNWMRENFGHKEGESWSCDRAYYENEERPELPKGGGRRAWLEQFQCYDLSDKGRWYVDSTMAQPRHRAILSIKDSGEGPEKISNALAIFAMLFL